MKIHRVHPVFNLSLTNLSASYKNLVWSAWSNVCHTESIKAAIYIAWGRREGRTKTRAAEMVHAQDPDFRDSGGLYVVGAHPLRRNLTVLRTGGARPPATLEPPFLLGITILRRVVEPLVTACHGSRAKPSSDRRYRTANEAAQVHSLCYPLLSPPIPTNGDYPAELGTLPHEPGVRFGDAASRVQ